MAGFDLFAITSVKGIVKGIARNPLPLGLIALDFLLHRRRKEFMLRSLSKIILGTQNSLNINGQNFPSLGHAEDF